MKKEEKLQHKIEQKKNKKMTRKQIKLLYILKSEKCYEINPRKLKAKEKP